MNDAAFVQKGIVRANAPFLIRAGNMITDLIEMKTIVLPSINRAKRTIRDMKLPRGAVQSMTFGSKNHRRSVLWKMHTELQKLHARNGRSL
jgi:hypothetical protein